jgi:hypothetical protein
LNFINKTKLKIAKAETLSAKQKQCILKLWNNEYPEQLQFHDLSAMESYLSGLSGQCHYFATDNANKITGWGFTFNRENKKWFAIIIDGSRQKTGIGSSLLNTIKQNERVLNGWVVDHDNYVKHDQAHYISPLTFYLKNDFKICSSERLETDKLTAIKITWEAPKTSEADRRSFHT